MSFFYSHPLSPNSPVDAYTLVGKYEYVVAARGYRSNPGHTFRATHKQTYFLNVLASSFPAKRLIRRRFVDLDARMEPADRIPRTYQDSLKQCLLQPYVQACTVTSRVVCFIDSDMKRIAQNYINWVEKCGGIIEEAIKPTAVIVLCGIELQKSIEELAFEFFKHCTATVGRSEIHSRSSHCFRRTEMLYYSRLARRHSKHDTVNWALLGSIREKSEFKDDTMTYSSGYYWRERIMHQLFESSIDFFCKRTNVKPPAFSIAHALTSDLSRTNPELPHQLAFFASDPSSRKSSLKGQSYPTEATNAVLGMYMAHHLLTHCPLLESENFALGTAPAAALFEAIFRRRYAKIEEQLVREETISNDPNTLSRRGGAKLHMLRAINEYLAVDVCVTQTHIRALAERRDFFQYQCNPQRLCSGCFFAYWDDVLPCGHGFCKSCTHNFSPQWRHSARLQLRCCPVCQITFTKPLDVKVQPPTAGGRILSLDGGGVRGVIGLELLHNISDQIGGLIPLHNLFDMAIGTSIGMWR
jgi:hypothetical protein